MSYDSRLKFSSFDELRVVQRTNIFQIKSIYGVSKLRDVTTGNVTQAGGEFVLSNAGDGDTTILDTAERCPYEAGFSGEGGIGVRFPAKPPAGVTISWGIIGNLDGWAFRLTENGIYRVVLRDGVESTLVQLGAWNEDGTEILLKGGTVGSFKPSDGYNYQLEYSWYAYGPTFYSFQLRSQSRSSAQWIEEIGRSRPEGEPSVTDPQQPLRVQITSEAGADPYTMYVGGRQFSILGPYEPISRKTVIENTVSVDDDAWVPVMAVRRKAITPYALTQIESIFLRFEGALKVLIVLNPTLPSPNYVAVPDYDDNETLLEVDFTPCTTFGSDGGTLLNYLQLDSGSKNAPGSDRRLLERLPMIEQQPFVIYLRRFTGNKNIDVDAFIGFTEEY